jgi:hypothetical protein
MGTLPPGLAKYMAAKKKSGGAAKAAAPGKTSKKGTKK